MKVKDLRKVMDDCWFFIVDRNGRTMWNEELQGEIPRYLLKRKVKVAVAGDSKDKETWIGVQI